MELDSVGILISGDYEYDYTVKDQVTLLKDGVPVYIVPANDPFDCFDIADSVTVVDTGVTFYPSEEVCLPDGLSIVAYDKDDI